MTGRLVLRILGSAKGALALIIVIRRTYVDAVAQRANGFNQGIEGFHVFVEKIRELQITIVVNSEMHFFR